jgi:hypothetical protein
MSIPLCRHCKYFRPLWNPFWFYEGARCAFRSGVFHDPVAGGFRKIHQSEYCSILRNDEQLCGWSGKWFKPKDRIWRRLLLYVPQSKVTT